MDHPIWWGQRGCHLCTAPCSLFDSWWLTMSPNVGGSMLSLCLTMALVSFGDWVICNSIFWNKTPISHIFHFRFQCLPCFCFYKWWFLIYIGITTCLFDILIGHNSSPGQMFGIENLQNYTYPSHNREAEHYLSVREYPAYGCIMHQIFSCDGLQLQRKKGRETPRKLPRMVRIG